MKPEWFKLFDGVVPVAGKDNFAVYDLNRQRVHHVQPLAYHQLEMIRKRSLTELYKRSVWIHKDQLSKLIKEMENWGWGFRTTEPERFTEMPLEWFCNSHLQQAVVEYAEERYPLALVIKQLDNLLCKNLELRLALDNTTEKHLTNILDLTNNCSFRSIHLVINHTSSLVNGKGLFTQYPKLARITFCNAPRTFSLRLGNKAKIVSSQKSLQEIERQQTTRYVVNLNFFCESLHFNPYYNRKICIDGTGQIKNCLSHERSFGNVQQVELKNIVRSSSFTALWHVKPDRIREVKGNAFRYAMFIAGCPRPISGSNEFTLI